MSALVFFRGHVNGNSALDAVYKVNSTARMTFSCELLLSDVTDSQRFRFYLSQATHFSLLASQIQRQKTGFAIAINLMYGMASLSSTFALLLVTESSIKSKHVQKVSGVYLSNFWFSALLWDLVNFLLPCLLMLVRKEPLCLRDCVSKT